MSRPKGSKNKPKIEREFESFQVPPDPDSDIEKIPNELEVGLNQEGLTLKPKKVKQIRGRLLTRYELETVINFNKAEDEATLFTYEPTWQRHIEKRMGIQPYLVNDFGGKSYKMPKSRIGKPRAFRTGKKKIMTPELKAKLLAGRKRSKETTIE